MAVTAEERGRGGVRGVVKEKREEEGEAREGDGGGLGE